MSGSGGGRQRAAAARRQERAGAGHSRHQAAWSRYSLTRMGPAWPKVRFSAAGLVGAPSAVGSAAKSTPSCASRAFTIAASSSQLGAVSAKRSAGGGAAPPPLPVGAPPFRKENMSGTAAGGGGAPRRRWEARRAAAGARPAARAGGPRLGAIRDCEGRRVFWILVSPRSHPCAFRPLVLRLRCERVVCAGLEVRPVPLF